MIAPDERFQHAEVKPCNYLIQNIDDHNFLIHRELSIDEYPYYKRERTFEYQNKKYLYGIVQTRSEKEAEMAIRFFWEAINQLNQKTIKN